MDDTRLTPLLSDAVDETLARLFKLLQVDAPRQGSVVLVFHEDKLQRVEPKPIIHLRRRVTDR